MFDLETLSAREEIKELKARYFRFTDTHDFTAFGELFTADAVLEAGELNGPTVVAAQGREAIVEQTRSASLGMTKIHHGHNSEITITGPDRASAIWSAEYIFYARISVKPQCMLHSYVYYYEDYRRVEGTWLFDRVKIVNVQTVVP
jgi:hypothetical protein